MQELYNTFFKDYPDVLNISQLSELLDISTKLTAKLLKENKIKHIKAGREYKIAKFHVLTYLNIIPEDTLSELYKKAS